MASVAQAGIHLPGALIHVFNKYSLSAWNVPGTVLGAGVVVLREKDIGLVLLEFNL